jgi:hypothetical protein
MRVGREGLSCLAVAFGIAKSSSFWDMRYIRYMRYMHYKRF